MSKVTHFRIKLTPLTSFAVREEGKGRKKEDKADYFIKRIAILGGQSIIDEVKKQ